MGKTRLIVMMDGGRIDHLVADKPMEVIVVDPDVEGLDDEEVVNLFGEEAYLADMSGQVVVDMNLVADYFREICRKGCQTVLTEPD